VSLAAGVSALYAPRRSEPLLKLTCWPFLVKVQKNASKPRCIAMALCILDGASSGIGYAEARKKLKSGAKWSARSIWSRH